MVWHHKMCPYAHYPHKNVLPNMPNRNKPSHPAKQEEASFLPQTVTISIDSEKLLSKHER